ncbi:MAG TPA: PIN domain-containing protein [Rhizobiales bacterium]|nr:PIN domain-containing protein [Hyphomicrobiales bacterium]
MPGVRVFLDANIILYLHDRREAAKGGRAVAWLTAAAQARSACTNLQVLNEVASVLLRKKWYATPAVVHRIVDDLAAFGSEPVTMIEVEAARLIHDRHGYSWWDSLLLASALRLGCSHFLSEDLQDGQVIAGLTIVDPFAHSPGQILPSY